MKYLVWSLDYSHASAGPKALHRLCHELNQAGQEAAIGNGYAVNPEWDTPHGEPGTDTIAVYPEVVRGNPWGAPRVARWVLNRPGVMGGDLAYDPSEMVFAWDASFLAGVPLLQLPTIEDDIYRDLGLPRSGALVWVGKGARTSASAGDAEVTLEMRLDRHALADALNRAAVLHSMDPVSGMNWIAGLCGCPVEVVPTGERIEPAAMQTAYRAVVEAVPGQLRAFIEITQATA